MEHTSTPYTSDGSNDAYCQVQLGFKTFLSTIRRSIVKLNFTGLKSSIGVGEDVEQLKLSNFAAGSIYLKNY